MTMIEDLDRRSGARTVDDLADEGDTSRDERIGHGRARGDLRSALLTQTSFTLDERTIEALDKLKKIYGVTSNAAVIKRALRIALIASRYADANEDIHFAWNNGSGTVEIVVPQVF